MPLALGWFLGSVFMLFGLASAWVLRRTNIEAREALRSRMRVTGTITRVAPVIDDPWMRSCTVEYVVADHRYQISAELEEKDSTVGRTLDVMALPAMPSDAVLLQNLRTVSFRGPAVTFCFGAALVAWGYL